MKFRTTIFTALLLLMTLVSFAQLVKNDDVSFTIANPIRLENRFPPAWEIQLTLKNNSKDTLRYFTMSCSWNDVFHADTARFYVRYKDCDKNHLIIVEIKPRDSKVMQLEVMASPYSPSQSTIRIGFNFIQPTPTKRRRDFWFSREMNNPSNLIWSNTIDLP